MEVDHGARDCNRFETYLEESCFEWTLTYVFMVQSCTCASHGGFVVGLRVECKRCFQPM